MVMIPDGKMGQRVKVLRKEMSLSQEDLAKKAHTTQGIIQKIEANRIEVPKCTFELSQILKTTPEYLLYGKGISQTDTLMGAKIPILGWDEVSEWCADEDSNISANDKEFIFHPTEGCRKDYFALKVNSPSMNEIFPIGSIVILKPTENDEIESGKFFLCHFQNRSFLRKAVIDSKVYLLPCNSRFDLEVKEKEVKIIAEVIGCYLNFLSNPNYL